MTGSDSARFRSASLEADFENLGEIGRGGMGVVHRARHRATGDVVAVKIIRARYLEDVETISRFEREANTASVLRHRNIVAIHELRRLEDGGIALVMQYVPGRTLKEVIKDTGPMPYEIVERALRDVAAALALAHSRHIVHRDVKPENIFLDEVSGRALLADFGIARSTDQDSSLTLTGVAIGTPAYMSPEQIDGGELDGRSDLYSLGLVGWEMLGARRPWEGESLYGVIYRQKHEDLPAPESLRPDVPPRLAHAIGWVLQKEPRHRPSNVQEFLRQLDTDERLYTPPPPRRGVAPPPPTADPASTMRFDRPRARPIGEAGQRGGPGTAGVLPPLGFPTDATEERGAWWRSRAAALAALVALPVLLLVVAVATGAISVGEPTEEPVVTIVDEPIGVPMGPPAADVEVTDPEPILLDEAENGEEVPVEEERPFQPLAPVGPTPRTPAWVEQPPLVQRETVVITQPAPRPEPAPSPAPVPTPTPAPTARPDEVVTVVAGGTHSCALTGGGELLCWGGNDRGQLATEGPRRTVPAGSASDQRFASLSAGLGHSCALTRAGEAYCWGGNASGQLGTGTTTSAASPQRVFGGRAFRMISSGVNHTCGVARTGEAYCWGGNGDGQVGDGTTVNRTVPVRLAGGGQFTDIMAGRAHSCAVSNQQVVYCWGSNGAGQLGDGTTSARPYPAPVSGTGRFSAVAAGNAHSCALTTAGEVYCWGDNSAGQLGDGSTTSRGTPTRIAGEHRFTAVVAGSMHTCGVTRGGEAYCWGRNSYGQLGDGSSGDRNTPIRVRGGHTFRAISATGAHTCGVSAAGEALCWGYNVEGQLGDGSRSHRSTPVGVGRPPG